MLSILSMEDPMTISTRPHSPYDARYHRDGTVTYWSVYQQVWVRADPHHISDEEYAAMSRRDRDRCARIIARRDGAAD